MRKRIVATLIIAAMLGLLTDAFSQNGYVELAPQGSGRLVSKLPQDCKEFHYNGTLYYTCDGVYYKSNGLGQYAIVQSPVIAAQQSAMLGSVIATLPLNSQRVEICGISNFYETPEGYRYKSQRFNGKKQYCLVYIGKDKAYDVAFNDATDFRIKKIYDK